MKKWFFLSMMALVCFSCYTDEAVMNPEIKFNPEEASSPYVIPVEEALEEFVTGMMVDSAVGTLAITPPGPDLPGLPDPTIPVQPVKPPIYRTVIRYTFT